MERKLQEPLVILCQGCNNLLGKIARAKFLNAKTNPVPSSSLSRAFEFAGLGLKLATSVVGGKIKGKFVNSYFFLV